MNHILDNPIYHSLITAHHELSIGTIDVKFYNRAMASFAGFKSLNNENFNWLYQNHPDEGVFILFTLNDIDIPEPWKLIAKIEMCQMVYDHNEMIEIESRHSIQHLNNKHINNMKELVALTKPGPFIEKTIDFGNYIGIFEDDKLASINGQRFNPLPYREISTVCTHPNFLGKGYALELLAEQVNHVIKQNEIPFLHVRADNFGAIKLYEKVGFKIRTGMKAYVIGK